MITVKVTYGIKEEFVTTNKQNIAAFMRDFKSMGAGFEYDVYTLDDCTTFVHLSSYENEEIQQRVLNTPSFKEFQRQRDESGLTKAHTIDTLTFVVSSYKNSL